MFPALLVLHHHIKLFSSVKHRDSALTVENTEHGLEVCNSPVRHWAYGSINIFGLMEQMYHVIIKMCLSVFCTCCVCQYIFLFILK